VPPHDAWFLEKLAHFDRKVIPERRMSAEGWKAFSAFTATHVITKYTKTKIFSQVGKKSQAVRRFFDDGRWVFSLPPPTIVFGLQPRRHRLACPVVLTFPWLYSIV